MLHRKSHRSELGMGLLEVVVASGILVVIALGISNVIVNSQQGAQAVQKHLDSGQLQSFISQVLNTPQLCSLSLAGQNVPAAGVSVPTLNFATIKIDDSTNSLFNNGQIKITSLKYKGAPTISGSTYAAIIELQVSLQGTGTQAVIGGNTAPPVDFPLVATVAGGKIVSCAGGGGVSPNIQTGQFTSGFCAPSASSGVGCVSFFNWSTPFADTNYAVTCNPIGPLICVHNCGGNSSGFHVSEVQKFTDHILVETAAGVNNQGEDLTMPEMDCIAIHP